ncbi:hypothetical protein OROGR_019109 [Orobanche gracilis]
MDKSDSDDVEMIYPPVQLHLLEDQNKNVLDFSEKDVVPTKVGDNMPT